MTLYPDVLSFTSVTKRPQLWRVAVVAGLVLGGDRKVYEEIFSGAAPRLETENTDSLGLVTPAAAAGAAANDV